METERKKDSKKMCLTIVAKQTLFLNLISYF